MRTAVRSLLPLTFATLLIMDADAQNIGINVTGAAPNTSALLDVDATGLAANNKKGLLIPRMTSAERTSIPAPATGLLVYDTTTNTFWYFDGTQWVQLGNASNDWTILGNGNTNAATNFLGTTNNVDLVISTANMPRMRVMGATGRVGIGTAAPSTILEASSGVADAIYGHSTNVGGYLGRETNITFGNPVQTLLGAGVYANNPAAGYTSIYAQSTGSATVAASITYSNVWIGQYTYVDNASSAFNSSASYNQLNVTNSALGGFQMALRGYMNRGNTAGNPGYSIGTQGLAYSANQDAIGVYGFALSNASIRMGGYFEGDNFAGNTTYGYAYVGGTTNGATVNKIIGLGNVSEIVPSADHGRIKLTCPESPEYWYQDYGTVEMVNGHAHVDLDPILKDIIVVDPQNPLRVFCTPVDMPQFNGTTVMNRTATGFDIVELNGGDHSGPIDYQIVAKPKTNFGEGRFPQAPGPAWLKPEFEPAAARADNQPTDREIFTWPPDWQVYGYDVDAVTPIGGMVPAGPHKGMFKVAAGVFSDHIPATAPKE
ncbi:MAG: hypothetical protein H6597_08350 [Flavobacteriales bacterium]|nr:hypothetical protein [Flavobacteriales bacterium]MCB9194526.1 hypothetical protein [Flavobacteriales bacterium]